MPKLTLQFENRVLREVPLGREVTIGRLPDNTLVIDNPAVSGHHARVFLDGDLYIVEDLRSRNGTYVNEKHVLRGTLQNGDVLLVGKHKLVFDESAEAVPEESKPVLPTLGETSYLDTRKHRELLARLREERARERARVQAGARTPNSDMPGHIAVLRVVAGETDQPEYPLQARTTFIGKSEAAIVRLRGWFAPKAAAAIERTDQGYVLTVLKGKVLINSVRLNGRHQLNNSDVLECHGLVLRFQLPAGDRELSSMEPANAIQRVAPQPD